MTTTVCRDGERWVWVVQQQQHYQNQKNLYQQKYQYQKQYPKHPYP